MTLASKPMKFLSLLLSGLLLLSPAAIPLRAADETPVPASIAIAVIDGEGAIHHVGERAARVPVVRVSDEAGRPVRDAAVVFTLPTDGPSGEFSGGHKTLTVTTDAQGTAKCEGLKTNRIPGKLQIHVTASYRGRLANALLTQFNMETPGARKGGSGKLIVILAIVGAGAAGGVLAATRKSGSNSAAAISPGTAIVISPGASTVGAPH